MKKGFTLIELLVTIVLLGILITLTTISIVKIRENITDNLYDNKLEYIVTGAEDWGYDNLNLLNSTTCKCVTVDTLISSGYISGDKDDRSNLDNPLEGGTLNSSYACVKYIGASGTYSSNENVYNTEVVAEYVGTTCTE